jgi:hypothetical protein
LILAVCANIFEEGFWSQARARAYEDHLPLIEILLAMMVGILVMFALPGKRVGFGYALLVPLIFFSAFHLGWNTSPVELTERRGAAIAGAIEEYRQQTGRYPERLSELKPGHLLVLSPPVGNLMDQSWCYDAGGDYYRLGYLLGEYTYFRRVPIISIQVLASAGNPPEPFTICEEMAQQIRTTFAGQE